MTQTLREFLREYGAKLPENVLDGRIRSVLSNPGRTKLFFETEYDAPVPSADLFAAETELTARLKLAGLLSCTSAGSFSGSLSCTRC